MPMLQAIATKALRLADLALCATIYLLLAALAGHFGYALYRILVW